MSEQDIQRQIDELKSAIESIKENHIAHLSEDIFDLKEDIGGVRADIKWIKLVGGFVVVESLGILVKLFIK